MPPRALHAGPDLQRDRYRAADLPVRRAAAHRPRIRREEAHAARLEEALRRGGRERVPARGAIAQGCPRGLIRQNACSGRNGGAVSFTGRLHHILIHFA